MSEVEINNPPQSEDSSRTVIPPVSPVTSITSNKLSSGTPSNTSKVNPVASVGSAHQETFKIAYVNERKSNRDVASKPSYSNRPKNLLKEVPDVKHMEKALLELLDDFQTGKLKAFGPGCSMEQMINIRDQQEHLSRLHFKLGANVDFIEGSESSMARDKIKQLVENLETLSISIENLHSGETT